VVRGQRVRRVGAGLADAVVGVGLLRAEPLAAVGAEFVGGVRVPQAAGEASDQEAGAAGDGEERPRVAGGVAPDAVEPSSSVSARTVSASRAWTVSA